MVTLNQKDGGTLKLDLSNADDRDRFNEIGRRLDPSSPKHVTAIWFHKLNQPVTLPIPSRFRRVSFYCEPLIDRETQEFRGEVVHIQADDVRMSVTAYRRDGGMVRIDLRHTGKQRFGPGGTT